MTAGIEAARSLLTRGTTSWPRGCAFLLRMELEAWVRHQSGRLDENLPRATIRSQLICLPLTVPQESAQRTSYAWHRLSEACHQHAYELAPTVAELEWLLTEVRHLVQASPERSPRNELPQSIRISLKNQPPGAMS